MLRESLQKNRPALVDSSHKICQGGEGTQPFPIQPKKTFGDNIGYIWETSGTVEGTSGTILGTSGNIRETSGTVEGTSGSV